MKIERIEAIPVEIPLKKVFSGSGYRVASRNTIITRIHIASGLISEVYNGDNRAHGRDILSAAPCSSFHKIPVFLGY